MNIYACFIGLLRAFVFCSRIISAFSKGFERDFSLTFLVAVEVWIKDCMH